MQNEDQGKQWRSKENNGGVRGGRKDEENEGECEGQRQWRDSEVQSRRVLGEEECETVTDHDRRYAKHSRTTCKRADSRRI